MYESDFEERLYNERREKLKSIAELGAMQGLSEAEATYPNSFPVAAPGWTEQDGALVPWLKQKYDSPEAPVSTEQLAAEKVEVAIAGRVMAIRLQGKAGFAHIQQGGERLQIYVRKDDVGEDAFALYKLLDLGDHIGVRGFLMRTRTGELTIHAAPIHLPGQPDAPALTFLAKAMLALPDKFHGLEDTELRYRQRYLDLFMNTGNASKVTAAAEGVILSEAKNPRISSGAPQTPTVTPDSRNVRDTFVKRAAILRAIRRFFDSRGYLEVETPMLHTIAGGAAARPFKTHHNALDIPLSLRIAPELFLKRLVVGGLDRVYEINRNFRNEGISTQHNPEFTMLEFYQAYSNYHHLMDLTEELVKFVANEVIGTTKTKFNDHEIDLSKWTRLCMREAIVKFWPSDLRAKPKLSDFDDENSTLRWWSTFLSVSSSEKPSQATIAKGTRMVMESFKLKDAPVGKIIAMVFENVAEEHLIQPTIIYDFPLAVSPLSKIKPDEPEWVERFEFYIGGFEVGNAFSELNDPDDQRRRFEAQLLERERGDDEAHAMDEDYVRALGYGLPPTAGEGIGIDRLTMILTGSKSIRDVILFPLMRPQAKPQEDQNQKPEQR